MADAFVARAHIWLLVHRNAFLHFRPAVKYAVSRLGKCFDNVPGKGWLIMAQKVQVVLIDDIDGGDADETVTFALDGVTYEIDLNADNAAKLRDAFALWVGSARRVSGRSSSARSASRSTGRRSASGEDTAAIREWAKQNGHDVSERGRISAVVREAYNKAH